MPWGVAAAVVGGVIASDAQRSAANSAADAQTSSANAGIEEQRRQFEALQKLLSPYAEAGTGSLKQQQDILGLNGPEAQQRYLQGLQNSPIFTGLAAQGENSILQNASATGGLRGGNTQAALSQFRPNLLNSLLSQQYDRLGGITALGQNAAAGVGNAGMQTGRDIAGLYGQQGAATAGAALAGGRATGGLINSLGQAAGNYYGMGGFRGGAGGGADNTGYYDAGGLPFGSSETTPTNYTF